MQFWISINMKLTTINKDWHNTCYANYKFAPYLITKEFRKIYINLLSKQFDFSSKEKMHFCSMFSLNLLKRFFNFAYCHRIKNMLFSSKDQKMRVHSIFIPYLLLQMFYFVLKCYDKIISFHKHTIDIKCTTCYY